MIGYAPFLGQVPLQFEEVRYGFSAPGPALAQVPAQPSVSVPAPGAAAAASRNKTLALVASGVGAFGGGVAAYGHYLRAGQKMNNWAVAATVFAAANLAIFAFIAIDG